MRLRRWGFTFAASFLCVASTCPTNDPFPPKPIRPPRFASIEVTAIKTKDACLQAIDLKWSLAGKDTLPVDHFVLLRKKEFSDSAFSDAILDIPDSAGECWDKLSSGDIPGPGTYRKIWYRIFVVDTSGGSGDTSAADSIILSWPPALISPETGDTLRGGVFKWSTVLYRSGYYTYLYLWSDSSGFLWKSERPAEPIYGHETPDSESLVLPSPPAPLARGKYFCGVKVEIPGAAIQSMALRPFYAP
jgi:hypothetical protein